ncbi:hypothetical protein T492DRAFT_1042991 [Pavlovales sp. CCMP2436]|nr:hypothetical protein T492DRAFT_1042991 [Pavlovales sp. CCMP2436]
MLRLDVMISNFVTHYCACTAGACIGQDARPATCSSSRPQSPPKTPSDGQGRSHARCSHCGGLCRSGGWRQRQRSDGGQWADEAVRRSSV